jgi:hypothetical protein
MNLSKTIIIIDNKTVIESAGNRSNNFPLGIGKDQSVLLPSVVDLGKILDIYDILHCNKQMMLTQVCQWTKG